MYKILEKDTYNYNSELQEETRRNDWQAELLWIFIADFTPWVYYVSNSTLNAFHSLAHLILITTLKDNYPYFTDEKLKHREAKNFAQHLTSS